ncbi:MAG: EFR1 family ferrodoxin [Firmicutes bacterium]|nr:EFR1 family ferrodoxin [Bacillota bacterium]
MKVLYFTGTGNSRFVAERISKKTKSELIDLRPQVKAGTQQAVDDENVVFVAPTYAWLLPTAVSEWIEKADLTSVKRAWFVMTCGDSIGNACQYNRELVLKKGIEYMGTAKIIMPENYIAMFNTPGKAESRRIVTKSLPDIDRAIEALTAGKKFPPVRVTVAQHLLTKVVHPAFGKFFIKGEAFSVKDDCIACGKCAELCPMNNISLIDGKPEWGNGCIHCMACICYCPKAAIEYGTATATRERYTFEGIEYNADKK